MYAVSLVANNNARITEEKYKSFFFPWSIYLQKQTTKDRVNNAVKYRESFRPFALAIIDKYADEFFDLKKGEKVPFMEKVVLLKKEKKTFSACRRSQRFYSSSSNS